MGSSLVYDIYCNFESSQDIQYEVNVEISKPLDEEIGSHIVSPLYWYSDLAPIIRECKPCVATCLIKIYIGGWPTSSSMHEQVVHTSIFGCAESKDNINLYIQCSPSLQTASQAIQVSDPFAFAERLCICFPDLGRVQLWS